MRPDTLELVGTGDPDFTARVSVDGETTRVEMAGVISERTVLELPSEPPEELVIDVSDVRRINSTGVRSWMHYIHELDALGIPVVVTGLSPAFVVQASMIASFLGKARITSFFAPYVCDDCDEEQVQPFAVGDDVPETRPCSACGGSAELELDVGIYRELRDLWMGE